ncbi:anion permease [Staphylococcus aureus]|nr:anion permease [Staphylococcus aureus]
MKNTVKYRKFILPIVVGLLIWALTPIKPEAVDPTAWYMFAIFVATIIACITQPMPIGAVSIIGFTIMVLVGIVDMKTAVAGFGNNSIWLIAMAFFISRGFVKTGLGRRIALHFVKLFGKKTLGLAYSIVGVDLILAPATPSNTARAGGIMFPIIKSLSESFGSKPKDESARKMGAFLVFTEFQGNLITAAMFLTAMAAQLNKLGFIPWLSKSIATSLGGLSWPIVLVILILFYFYSHYLFASSTAHISAMYAALLGVAIAAGAPPLFSALMLGFFGNLLASTTHYSSGPAPILFSSGYVTQKRWWTMNLILGFVYFIIWIGLGSLWMKVIGIF